ncbi:MAG: hypothetical protein OXL97_07245 [Chloroflexota bacterium]|nr:hypothetical protein [Chloroflexota bacterium]MDE2886411.1 hypothetical protein [Chloroflexota bacterium]
MTSVQTGPYAWRARAGMITPSGVHEMNSFEFYLMAPPGVSVAMTSLHTRGWGPDIDSFVRLEEATQEIAERGVGSLVQAGTPHVVHREWPYHRVIVERINAVTNIPASTDIGACMDAMQRLGMSRVVLLSPFRDPDNEALTAYVSHAGIEVVAWDSILDHVVGATGNFMYDIATLPLSTVYAAARRLYAANADRADGIWITGAAMPSVGIVEALEGDAGAPVVSSMQAMAWTGMRLAGLSQRIEGFGRLVREF